MTLDFRIDDSTHLRSAELGCWLAESVAGRGIMTGCVSALIDYAFQELRINRIELRAATGNDRSLSIAKRLGFTQEGIHRDAESLNDHSVDQVVYSILKREWDTEQDEGMGYTIINSVEEGVFYLEANPPSREEFLTSF